MRAKKKEENKHRTTQVKVHDLDAQNFFVPVKIRSKDVAKNIKEKDDTRNFLKKLGGAAMSAYSQKKLTKAKTGIVLSFVSSFALTIFTTIAVKTDLLPVGMLAVIIVVWGIIFCLLPILIILKGWTRLARIMCSSGLVILLLIGFFLNAVNYTFRRMQVGDSEKVIYAVIVRNDNERLKGLGYIAGNDVSFLESGYSDIAQDVLKKKIPKYAGVEYFGDMSAESNLQDLYDKFINDAKGSLILCLDQAQLQLASEKITDFDERAKIIYTFEAEVPSYRSNEKIDGDDSFVAYLSVVKQYDFGDKVGNKGTEIKNYYAFNYMHGLSEINRLVAVNARTHKMLVIDMPAKYYVQLEEGGASDELANVGVHGMEKSMEALEKLYGVKIDYYFRSTYENLEEIASAAGLETDFSDEAKSRETVDSMISRLTDIQVFLPHYDAVLMRVDKGIQTDLPVEWFLTLTKDMLENGNKWEVEYYAVSGERSEQTLGSLGTDAIKDEVIIPDESSLATARKKLKTVLEN